MKTQTRLLNLILIIAISMFYQFAKAQTQNVTIIDTIYTPDGFDGGPQPARLWLPEHPNGAGAILCHGGGLDYTSLSLWGDSLASHGYVVLSVDYDDLFDSVPCLYPNPVRDFKTGIEFLRRNAFPFGLYTGRIGAYGMSGGSFHLGQTIIWDNDDDYFQTDPDVNDHLDAVALNYGWYDYFSYMNSIFNTDSTNELDTLVTGYFSPDPSLRETKGNPFTNIDNITSPLLLMHGDSDHVLQVEQSIEFHDSLIARGKSGRLIIFPNADHVYDFLYFPENDSFDFTQFSDQGLIAKDSVLEFFEENLRPNENNCPHKKAYWKNHVGDWNIYATPMLLGTTTSYSQSELLDILNSPVQYDLSLRLADQLIAAKLNAANGADVSSIRSTILEADSLIGNRAIPIVPKIKPKSDEGQQMIALFLSLKAFNQGTFTPDCNGDRIAEDDGDDIIADMISVSPNPFSTSTAISFSLSQSENVSLKIFDVEGRLVRTLSNEPMSAGNHQFTWHIHDENGNTVSPGIYFLKIETAASVETKELSVIK